MVVNYLYIVDALNHRTKYFADNHLSVSNRYNLVQLVELSIHGPETKQQKIILKKSNIDSSFALIRFKWTPHKNPNCLKLSIASGTKAFQWGYVVRLKKVGREIRWERRRWGSDPDFDMTKSISSAFRFYQSFARAHKWCTENYSIKCEMRQSYN